MYFILLIRFELQKPSPYGHGDSGCLGGDIAYFGGHFNPITAIGSKSKQGFVGCLQQFYFNSVRFAFHDFIDTCRIFTCGSVVVCFDIRETQMRIHFALNEEVVSIGLTMEKIFLGTKMDKSIWHLMIGPSDGR